MSDPMTPEVKDWMKRTDVEPSDAQQSARQIMTRLPEVRQRRRWWPIPVFYRTSQTPTTTDTAESEPSPVSATNGHTPTVIGRTQSMLSPAKAITAGAIVFAIGGAFLIAQPFDQQSSIPGAAIDPCTTPVVPVTGTIIWGSEGPDTQRYTTDSGEHIRNFVFNSTMSLSDDRLDGSTTATGDWDQNELGGIYRGTRVIENTDGTWEGPETLVSTSPLVFYTMSDLTGTGAYDGLSAVLFIENNIDQSGATILGSIYPTDLASCDFSTRD